MNIKLNISTKDLELTRLGCRDCNGLTVNHWDRVVFTYLDDDFNNVRILLNNREELLAEIEKRIGLDNYQPWFYQKVIS